MSGEVLASISYKDVEVKRGRKRMGKSEIDEGSRDGHNSIAKIFIAMKHKEEENSRRKLSFKKPRSLLRVGIRVQKTD